MATSFWPKQKFRSVIYFFKNPFNTPTPITWPDVCGPLVTMQFHCIMPKMFKNNNSQLFTEVEVNSDGYLPSLEAAR